MNWLIRRKSDWKAHRERGDMREKEKVLSGSRSGSSARLTKIQVKSTGCTGTIIGSVADLESGRNKFSQSLTDL